MKHLLLVALGPVQDFIAQARRTRDLWFGSHLLSEVSRAAAATLAKSDAQLIFPALERGHEELAPSPGPLRATGKPALAIPNKILCAIDDDPESLASSAMRAAEARWQELAASVRHACKGLIVDTDEARAAWDEQIATFLELSAAWMPLREKTAYKDARDDLERELAGRKLLRDFPAWRCQRGGVPKSSLDGARETVLAEPAARARHLVQRYRVANTEQLDAVGLVKRAGGDPDQFVPIANVALAPWISAARQRSRKDLEEIAQICEAEDFKRVGRSDLPCGRSSFAWDAEIFLKDRWAAMLAEAAGELGPEEPRKISPARRVEEWRARSRVEAFLERMHPPFPYVACLVADGDRMGRALDTMPEVSQHRAFSERLSYFAERARRIIEQDHLGILVYAGGDDVLAFINVAKALACADALRRAFSKLVQEALEIVDPSTPRPTLSVGLGIGHLLESMGQLRWLGGEAEKLAKTRRNALGVLVDRRAGGQTRLREGWDGDPDPVTRIESAVSLLQSRQLSMKKVHEIGVELSRMPPPGALLDAEQETWSDLLRGEVARILSRSGEGDGLTAPEVGLDLSAVAGYRTRREQVEQWLSRMQVAKVIAEAHGSTRPKPPTQKERS